MLFCVIGSFHDQLSCSMPVHCVMHFILNGRVESSRRCRIFIVYLLLGAVGLPVFAGFKGGLGSLMGVTGGYLLGFVFSALAVGLITRFFSRSFPVLIVSMIVGLVLCYAFGSAWFQILYIRTKGAITTGAVLSACVIPYLIPDAIKIALAAVLVRRLQPHVSLAKA